jgi:hypothetical protein
VDDADKADACAFLQHGAVSEQVSGLEVLCDAARLHTLLRPFLSRWTSLRGVAVSGDSTVVSLDLECFGDLPVLTSLAVVSCEALESVAHLPAGLTALRVADNGCMAQLDATPAALATLRDLDCSGNALAALDLTGCGQLTSLECSSNALTRLVLAGCTALVRLGCNMNRLASLQLQHLGRLSSLRAACQQGGEGPGAA